ncbi:aminotransferase class I/II-fold pyridoxal phosphate-dependent enzyme, partial [Aquimarina celericrescens]|nr:aminotransferase class I/II-fold pyridoxal phosphate-dependent enzyme [Aquimarina celericrescens]
MSQFHLETEIIRSQIERSQHQEHSSPLYLTSSYVFEDVEEMRASFSEEKQRNIYSRFSNPNTSEFIDRIAKMEGAEGGYAFATGMSAVFSTLAALLNSGDHMISSRSVFGSTHSLFTKFFPKWNISHSYFKVNEVETIEKLITPTTKIIFAESPTNPGVDILDLELLGKIAKKHHLILVIDNCFATPYLQ